MSEDNPQSSHRRVRASELQRRLSERAPSKNYRDHQFRNVSAPELKLREELFARLDVEASVRNALELLKDQGLKGVLLEDEAGKPAAVVMTVDALIGLMYEDLMNTDGTFFTSRAGPHQPLKLFMPDTLVEQVDPTGNWLPDFPPVGPPPDKPLSD